MHFAKWDKSVENILRHCSLAFSIFYSYTSIEFLSLELKMWSASIMWQLLEVWNIRYYKANTFGNLQADLNQPRELTGRLARERSRHNLDNDTLVLMSAAKRYKVRSGRECAVKLSKGNTEIQVVLSNVTTVFFIEDCTFAAHQHCKQPLCLGLASSTLAWFADYTHWQITYV